MMATNVYDPFVYEDLNALNSYAWQSIDSKSSPHLLSAFRQQVVFRFFFNFLMADVISVRVSKLVLKWRFKSKSILQFQNKNREIGE